MLAKLNWYLQLMKEYYDTEVRIRNIFQEREKAARQLITQSASIDMKQFRSIGGKLVLKLRMLTVQLVFAVKRWKDMVMRATATFTVENARRGMDIGKQITILEKNEENQLIKSLRTSSGYASSSRQRPQTTNFKSARDKFSHEYRQDLKKKENDEKILQSCVLCHIFNDTSIQREGGLLVKKLASFTKDSVVFTMKDSE